MRARVLLMVVGVVAALVAVQPALAGAGGQTQLVANCKTGSFKPKKVILACADAGFRVRGVTWTEWERGEALGRGTGVVNDCKPNCAEGKFHTYPVQLRAFRPRDDGKCAPGRVFTRIRWSFPDKRPQGFPRSEVQPSGCP
jgi:hypothetical protein